MKCALEGEQQEKREKISELTSDLKRLIGERDRISAEMDRVTSKIGECRGMRTKFERDKKDLSAALVTTGRALGWEVEEVNDRSKYQLSKIRQLRSLIKNVHFFELVSK
jgi:chromosome segregation ATPase